MTSCPLCTVIGCTELELGCVSVSVSVSVSELLMKMKMNVLVLCFVLSVSAEGKTDTTDNLSKFISIIYILTSSDLNPQQE